jgi:lysophospholipase L1-like esterase
MLAGSAFRLALLGFGAVMLAVAGCVTGQASDPAGGPDQAQAGASGQSLASFQRSLEQLRAGKLERVNVLQIGDSHTAGDHFSGRLRDLLQEKFGNAGRGMMPAGYPFPYWRPYQVEVQQRGSWTVLSSNRTDYPQLPYGLSGFITRSQRRDDTMTLQAKPDAGFDTVDIDFFLQPRGGHVIVTVDGRRVDDIDTSGRAYELSRKTITVSPGSSSLELRTRGDGVVDIADWAIYRRERGVTLSSHGFVGAEIGLLDRWNWSNVTKQLHEMAPTLVILAFGTNEGFGPSDRLGDYQSVYESRLAQFRQSQPGASIVVVGPPDADRLPDYCGMRGASRQTVGCRPLSSSEAADYGQMLRGRNRGLCQWHPPAGLAVVKAAQQQAARRYGAYFWDWSSVQGGACGADRWVSQGLQRSDHVHMYEAGYQLSADQLFAELLRGYRGR